MKDTAVYLRMSTDAQDEERQRKAVRQYQREKEVTVRAAYSSRVGFWPRRLRAMNSSASCSTGLRSPLDEFIGRFSLADCGRPPWSRSSAR